MPVLHTSQTNNIYIPGLNRQEDDPAALSPERDRYIRGYSDEEVALLPEVPEGHLQSAFWGHRKASCRRLLQYLALKNKTLSILEVGCGNGWLSFQLSSIPGNRVLGLDRDLHVLRQAARVFQQPNLKFMCGDFYSDIMAGLTFDTIIFSASIQYFPSLNEILSASLLRLKEKGEIHILDTPVRRRDLSIFKYRLMFNPRSLGNRLLGKSRQMPWIRVTNYRVNR